MKWSTEDFFKNITFWKAVDLLLPLQQRHKQQQKKDCLRRTQRVTQFRFLSWQKPEVCGNEILKAMLDRNFDEKNAFGIFCSVWYIIWWMHRLSVDPSIQMSLYCLAQCTEAMRSEGFVLLPELLLFVCHVMVTLNGCLKRTNYNYEIPEPLWNVGQPNPKPTCAVLPFSKGQ